MSFFGVAGVFFLGVACVVFVVRKQQSRAKALFGQPWAVGLGLLLALGFLSLGFRFGLTLFRASAWVSSVFRVSAFFQACLRIFQGIGLGVLRFHYGLSFIRVRSGFTPFRASAWVSSFLGFRLSFKLAFASFRVLGWVYSVFIMGFLSLGFGLALLRLGLRPGFDRFWGFGLLSSLPFPAFRVPVSEYSFFS